MRRRLYPQVSSLEDDVRGREIVAAMAERAAAGVEVGMLVDGYGSLELGPAALRGAFDDRNHRKLVVADGAVAWAGGGNLARKYPEEFVDGSHWTDLSLAIDGPAAAVFESVFRSDRLAARAAVARLRRPGSGLRGPICPTTRCSRCCASRAAAGARVALFESSMLHAKIVLLDDRVALVGSANFDMRSLFTNHEVAAVLYSPEDIAAVATVVEGYAARSSALRPPERFATTALSGALRILAPVM